MEDQKNQPNPPENKLLNVVFKKLEEFKKLQESQGLYLRAFERSVWLVTHPDDRIQLFQEIENHLAIKDKLDWHYAIMNFPDFGQVIFQTHELIPIGDPQVFHNGEFNVLTKEIHDYARARA